MTSNQQHMLDQRHEAFKTPEEIIFTIIKNDTGYTPLRKTKIVKGYDSEVYSIDTKENHTLIFKIKHFGTVSFQQETWAINECKMNSIPVPTILSIGKLNLGKEEAEYTIQDKVDGIPFADIHHNLTSQQIQTVLFNAGKILRKIHAVRVNGFYQRHENGVWDFSSWEKYAESFVTERSKEKDQIIHAGFTESEFKTMIHFLEIYKDTFICSQPVLCHGDYLPEHIFVDNDLKISAIIDFGMFEGNSPVHDLAFFAIEAPSFSISSLIEGYGKSELFDDRFTERLLLHMLMLEMGHLAHSVREGLKPESDFVTKRLKDTFEKLSQENI